MNELVTTLYRPVGQADYDLIKGSRFHEFPPRLPEQPIFYPVLSEYYAKQIARDWNKTSAQDLSDSYYAFMLRRAFFVNMRSTLLGVPITENIGFLLRIWRG